MERASLRQITVHRSEVLNFALFVYRKGANEGVSLLENASHLGLPVPDKLKAILSQLHNKQDQDK